ncbi:MAG TPA: serine/threonine protein kinase [Candidatus Angelobacter sp.]|nr:serine/threonine protein kinase [Candidatus Angelobacter sp.]
MVDESVLVPLQDLARKPYRELLAYPNPSDESVQSRIRQLNSLGIEGLEFVGPLRMGKLSVLGKGVVGLVFRGIADDHRVAVKIRRTDSRRSSMIHEAEMMKAANKAGIGPKCLGSSEDTLEMQLLEGQRLPLWISSLKGRGRKARVKATVKALLEQCIRLDAYGLDHGELSRAHKNVLVSEGDHPWILDYESASLMRRVNNFTSLAQYILLSGRFSRKVIRILGPFDQDELVKYLRLYKSGKTNDAFESTMKLLQV